MTDDAAKAALEMARDEFAGHTPEPDWKTHEISNVGLFLVRPCQTLQVVPEVDARLMAAAPRLLRERNEARAQRDRLMEAIRRLTPYVQSFSPNHDEYLLDIENAIRKVRAEIAEGGEG